MQKDLTIRLSELELEKKEHMEKLQGDVQKKEDAIDGFQKEILKITEQVKSLEEQAKKLHSMLEEKEQLILQYNDKAKQLESQNAEVTETLASRVVFILSRHKACDGCVNNLSCLTDSGTISHCRKQARRS